MNSNLSDEKILKMAIQNGIIDISTIKDKVNMAERKKYLDMHNKNICHAKDGNYYTRIDGRLVKRKSLESLEDEIIKFYRGDRDAPTLEWVFNAWIDNKLHYKEIQKQTYDRYKADYVRFIKGSVIDIQIKDIDSIMLEDYIRETIATNELTAKAWSKLRLILIGTFKWGKKHGYTELSIIDFLQEIELSPKIFKRKRFVDEESVFTNEEIAKIENYINDKKPSIVSLGILLAFCTGLRVGELSALKWEDIKENYIVINKTQVKYKDDSGNFVYEVRDNAKTDAGDRRVIILSDAKELLHKIKLLNPFGEYVFMYNGERIKSNSFTKKLIRICESEKITPKSMHKARKTYATKLLEGGVSKKLIINQMGHTNIDTTEIFYHFNNNSLEESQSQIKRALEMQ